MRVSWRPGGADARQPPVGAAREPPLPGPVYGVTVSVADAFVPPPVAVMAADVVAFTVDVVIVNTADREPVGTGTLAGTVAALLLDRLTTSPPAGAMPVSVTVPVDDVPPLTDVGLSVTLLTPGAFTVSAAVFVTLT